MIYYVIGSNMGTLASVLVEAETEKDAILKGKTLVEKKDPTIGFRLSDYTAETKETAISLDHSINSFRIEKIFSRPIGKVTIYY